MTARMEGGITPRAGCQRRKNNYAKHREEIDDNAKKQYNYHTGKIEL